ncbi:MAG: pilus assembly protein PilM [Clostridiaceae bacterium]
MNRLIFNVNEDSIEIVEVSNFFKKKKIKKIVNMELVPSKISGIVYNSKENQVNLNMYLKKNKIKEKKVELIFSLDGAITRVVEVPYMKEKDLKNYIKNNIRDYFTVNTEEYFFDYKITKIIEGEKKQFKLLLTAFPKDKLNDIKQLIEGCNFNIISIGIYPDCVSKIFNSYEESGIAVIDAGNKKCSITVLDKGDIFVYSVLPFDLNDENNYDEIITNINYFLDFYASRHFGNKIDKILFLGESNDKKEFMDYLYENVEGNIERNLDEFEININMPIDTKEENYIEVLGHLINNKNIYNKKIDFKFDFRSEFKNIKEKSKNQQMWVVTSGILIVLICVFGYSYKFYNLNQELKSYSDTSDIVVDDYDYNSDIETLNSEILIYKVTEDYINEIKKDDFDFLAILDGLKDSMPKAVSINLLSMNKTNVDITINIAESTLDIADAIIAVNNMEMFENYDIESVRLDDSDTEASFSLILKTSDVDVNTSEDGNLDE